MKKITLSIVMSLLWIAAPAYGADTDSFLCRLNFEFEKGIWDGIIVLAGTFGYMMVLMDRYSFSAYSDASAPAGKLYFRFNLWLPFCKVSLTALAVGLLYNLTTVTTGLGIATVSIFILFTFYLSWTTRCKQILNPLKDSVMDNIESSEEFKLKLQEIFKTHLMYYLAFYISVAVVFEIIAYLATQQKCFTF